MGWRRNGRRKAKSLEVGCCLGETFLPACAELHRYLKNVHFKNLLGDDIFFDENGDLPMEYSITNLIFLPNGMQQHEIVGGYKPYAAPGEDFTINDNMIVWDAEFTQTPPESKCSQSCAPGYRKLTKEGKPVCCYDCIPCPSGEISNETGEYAAHIQGTPC
uniref:Vomeronasal type-2 receptor 116-like isoform X2 n=2 Tax=Geotrypetes seraphini TaxID=260995 RepID=A0A6P8NMN7_GEOSA|nr:vomeronasal type-2 receptor 116-like isoform X2 [Geotrypetes seraphini]XP_033771875.1 vomeronasal type-2 receptor 116-like isoform X2 [Geotrypetes seraphini]